MTGPEHYREAERLLAEANKAVRGISPDHPNPSHRTASLVAPLVERLTARAQVHATLALTAAHLAVTMPISDQAWREAVGPKHLDGGE